MPAQVPNEWLDKVGVITSYYWKSQHILSVGTFATKNPAME